MNIVAAIRNLLLDNEAIVTRVGDRIYDNRLPQDISKPGLALSAIVLITLDDLPADTLDKQYDIKPTMIVQHFGATHKVTREMDAETRAVLQGYQGPLGDGAATIMRIDSRDDLEPDLDIAMKISEYRIWIE